jgi:nucleotide-binding universal stress UspA family protein
MSTDQIRHPTIVVGYDGSAAARAAVARAMGRVGATGHLIVVHTHGVPPDYYGAPFYQEALDRSGEQAGLLLDELEASTPELRKVSYELDAIAGPAADAICRVARVRGADEIVIGTRGVGRLRAVLGSVAHEVLHQAACPVTVIPERMVAPDEVAPTEESAEEHDPIRPGRFAGYHA